MLHEVLSLMAAGQFPRSAPPRAMSMQKLSWARARVTGAIAGSEILVTCRIGLVVYSGTTVAVARYHSSNLSSRAQRGICSSALSCRQKKTTDPSLRSG
jgi:hypothetical protein